MSYLPAFNDVTFRQVEREGKPWITASDLSRALGYKKTDAVSQLYDRNKGEFTPAMTAVELMKKPANDDDRPGPQIEGLRQNLAFTETRIFSLRGAHLVAMFAKTPTAATFRRWVLDVLEHMADPPPIAPAPAEWTAWDSARVSSTVALLREARRLYGPATAKEIWMQLKLPVVVQAGEDGDDLYEAARAFLAGRERVEAYDLVKALGLPQTTKSHERAEFLLTVIGWEERRTGAHAGTRKEWMAPELRQIGEARA